MAEITNFPRESTMKDIAQALQTMAFIQAGQAADISNWEKIAGLVSNRYAQQIFDYGDQFIDTWRDTAAAKDYEYPWQVNHFENVELETGETVPGMFLQAHYAHPFGVQFSQARAFLRCPDGLAAGTYNVTFGETWGKAVKDATYQFTTTQDVPARGCLAGFIQMPDVTDANWKVIVYAADRTTKLETVAVTKGNGGTNLGVMQYAVRSGNLNSMQETGYGWNRWKTSALRQYLNSDRPKGKWWTPQDDWDIAPDQLATKDGFLCGMSEDMLKAIKPIKVTTYANTVNDGGGADVTYDRVFLPSLEQMNVNPQISGEGTVHEYWIKRSGTTKKLAQYSTYPRLIHYATENHTSPQNVRLRSATRGGACYVWGVYASGYVYSYYYAWSASRFTPLVSIAQSK